MKNLFCMLLLASAMMVSVTGCSNDDDEGPAGSVEMLYGSWSGTHVWAEQDGHEGDMQLGPGKMMRCLFRPNGSCLMTADGFEAVETHWAYTPASRMLLIGALQMTVKTLTETTLITDFQLDRAHVVLTMAKGSSYAVMQSAAPCLPVLFSSLLSSLFESVQYQK